ncbi:hypothetical protein CRG98_040037 [Punica granatum]|uniref:Uncharacterized protein n=1 Tax=Punica granatum TaxID=22663 RepID=A0A2I0I6G1_PUNGR|nr:hypothetical protein CRG98_040037 [Punica granatum]
MHKSSGHSSARCSQRTYGLQEIGARQVEKPHSGLAGQFAHIISSLLLSATVAKLPVSRLFDLVEFVKYRGTFDRIFVLLWLSICQWAFAGASGPWILVTCRGAGSVIMGRARGPVLMGRG